MIKNGIEIIDFDEELAFEYLANQRVISVDRVNCEGKFFTELDSVFRWICLDDEDDESTMRGIIKDLGKITIENMNSVGAESVAEYQALCWENLHVTPYGYVMYYV